MTATLPAVVERAGLALTREPSEIVEEARRAAAALKDVIDRKPKKVRFNDEEYLEFEDWALLGRFYGIAPRITDVRYVQYGETRGWEAFADAVHVPSGRLVSSASSMCLDDESKWATRRETRWAYVRKSGGTSIEDPGRDELMWEVG